MATAAATAGAATDNGVFFFRHSPRQNLDFGNWNFRIGLRFMITHKGTSEGAIMLHLIMTNEGSVFLENFSASFALDVVDFDPLPADEAAVPRHSRVRLTHFLVNS